MHRRRMSALVATTLVLALAGTLTGCVSAAEPAATATVATAGNPVTHDENRYVPEGAAWTQHYFPSSDGSDVELHADVLLPEGLAPGEKVPVIMSAGAYFGHSGEMDVEGRTHAGPSDRFQDLVDGTDLFERGYALVLVDVRGFGGSTGCLDFAGPGEQADVRAAIDWSSTQPWSTGAVGMYGKSFDAITGLIGNNLDQDALKAVVAQEPIWDPYRNTRSNGVPRTTTVAAAGEYNTIATLPPMPDDDPRYRANAAYETQHPECLLTNLAGYQEADPDSAYWTARDLAAQAKGTDTPLLFTAGFLDWNTEPEAVEEFLANHRGPQRGWLGQWDHKRGNDRTPDGRLEMGREGWLEETMAFYDQHLKGIAPPADLPAFAVQDSNGAWRAQDTWPVADRSATLPLGGGRYVDDGAAPRTGPTANSYVTRSVPLGEATRITGTPRVTLDAQGRGNVMVELHDVAPDGTSVLFDRQVSLLRPGATTFDLRSTDWTLAPGHSLAVEVGSIRPGFEPDNDWIDTPSGETVTVRGATLTVALDDPADDVATQGARAPWLDTYRQAWVRKPALGAPAFTVPAARP